MKKYGVYIGWLVMALCVSALYGCSGGIFTKRAVNLGKSGYENGTTDRLVITNAKERAISYVAVDVEPSGARRIKPRRVVCAEPSPDVAAAVSDAISASLKAQAKTSAGVEGGVDAAFNRAFTESITQLGSRLATIQLLRDELSDLCRAYANGAVSSITYTLRLSRLDKKMITLLVSEASAGALARALVSINGQAQGGSSPVGEAVVQRAEEEVKGAAQEVSATNEALKKLAEEREKEKEKEKLAELDKKIADAQATLRAKLTALNDKMIAKWALDTKGSGLLVASTSAAIAGLPPASNGISVDLGKIHRSFLDNDDLGTLIDACLTSLEESTSRGSEDLEKKKTELQRKIVEKQLSLEELEAKGRQTEDGRKLASPNAPATPATERSAIVKARLELDAFYRELEDLYADGASGLATFCRTRGIDRIIDAMIEKITNRFKAETMSMYVDMCKAFVDKEEAHGTRIAHTNSGSNVQEYSIREWCFSVTRELFPGANSPIRYFGSARE